VAVEVELEYPYPIAARPEAKVVPHGYCVSNKDVKPELPATASACVAAAPELAVVEKLKLLVADPT